MTFWCPKFSKKNPAKIWWISALEFQKWLNQTINTSYLTDSYIIFTLKMESVSKNFQRSEINWTLTMNLNAFYESSPSIYKLLTNQNLRKKTTLIRLKADLMQQKNNWPFCNCLFVLYYLILIVTTMKFKDCEKAIRFLKNISLFFEIP